MMFWLLVILVLLLVLLLLLRPWSHAGGAAVTSDDPLRISIYRQNLRELDREFERGQLTAEQLANVRNELELSLLAELERSKPDSAAVDPGRRRVSRLSVAMPVVMLTGLSIPLYLYLGNPQLNELKQYSRLAEQTEGETPPPLDGVIPEMVTHLQKNPGDANGWLLLSDMYATMQQFAAAVDAMESLYRLTGDDPDVMLRLANERGSSIVEADEAEVFEPGVAEAVALLLHLGAELPAGGFEQAAAVVEVVGVGAVEEHADDVGRLSVVGHHDGIGSVGRGQHGGVDAVEEVAVLFPEKDLRMLPHPDDDGFEVELGEPAMEGLVGTAQEDHHPVCEPLVLEPVAVPSIEVDERLDLLSGGELDELDRLVESGRLDERVELACVERLHGLHGAGQVEERIDLAGRRLRGGQVGDAA